MVTIHARERQRLRSGPVGAWPAERVPARTADRRVPDTRSAAPSPLTWTLGTEGGHRPRVPRPGAPATLEFAKGDGAGEQSRPLQPAGERDNDHHRPQWHDHRPAHHRDRRGHGQRDRRGPAPISATTPRPWTAPGTASPPFPSRVPRWTARSPTATWSCARSRTRAPHRCPCRCLHSSDSAAPDGPADPGTAADTHGRPERAQDRHADDRGAGPHDHVPGHGHEPLASRRSRCQCRARLRALLPAEGALAHALTGQLHARRLQPRPP